MSRVPEAHVPRVLIVDDEEPLRRVLRTALFRAGYAVADAGSAQAAREALAVAAGLRMPFDLLVVDVGLPDMTGWQLLRQIRDSGLATVPSRDKVAGETPTPLRVIVISALRPAECRLQEFHPAGILIKPFPLEALVQLVERVLGGGEDELAQEIYEDGAESGVVSRGENAL